MNQKIVVALGGNAILSSDASAEAQQSALEKQPNIWCNLSKTGMI